MLRACLLLSLFAGFSAKDCDLKAKIAQELLNYGFHRNMTYHIKVDNNFPEGIGWNGYCLAAVSQTLPQGVFANPDELEDLRRLQKVHAILKNRVNVELPAEESQSISVFIITDLINGKGSTWFPVHARYHHAAVGGGFVRNNVPYPTLYLRCSDRRLDQCSQASNTINYYCNAETKEMCSWLYVPIRMVTYPVKFKVPIGNTSQYHFVAVVTAATVIAGSLYLLKTLHDYKIKGKHL